MNRLSRPLVILGVAVLVSTLLTPTDAAAQPLFGAAVRAPGTADSNVDHAERCLAAVDLAIIAAEVGILDVSIEAARRACQQGPPVKSVDLGGILGSRGQARMVQNYPNGENEAANAQAKLAVRLWKLHKVWKEKEADPLQAYEAWKNLVLPPDRPNEAFAYATTPWDGNRIVYGRVGFDSKEPKPVDCGAAALVEWARTADRMDDLRAAIAERESQPGAIGVVLLLKAILAADVSSSPDELKTLCQSLAERPEPLITAPNAELLFGHVWSLVERIREDSPEGAALIEAAMSSVRKDNKWPANEWLVFLVSRNLRVAIDSGDFEKFQAATDLAMSSYDGIRSGNQSYVNSAEASLYTQGAQRAFTAGNVKLGAACLKARGLITTSEEYGGPDWRSLIDLHNPIIKSLLGMSRGERYDTLADLTWSSPGLGMQRNVRMRASDKAPALFQKDLSDGPRTPKRGAESAQFYSTLEWVIRDAIALDRHKDVEDRIAKLEAEGSDDAKIAKAVYQLAKEEPLDLSLFTKPNDEGVSIEPPYGDGTVTQLDLAIIDQALASTELAEAGRAFLDERISAASKQYSYDMLTVLRKMKYEDKAKTEPKVTQAALRHWVTCDEAHPSTLVAGLPPASVWTQRDNGAWGHDFGPDLSHLVMRYPLAGDFTIAIQMKDELNGESGAAYGGMMVEFMKQNDAVWLWSQGNRNGRTDLSSDALKKDALNDIRLVCADGGVTLHVNDKFEKRIGKRCDAFPFFEVSGYRFRTTEVASVKIEGDVTIPRSVEMASPTMLGWSVRFTGGGLPDLLVGAEPDRPKLNEKSKSRPTWRCEGGEIVSVDLQALDAADRAADPKKEGEPYQEKRREALVQYLRPLADGEQVSLEFYYEPDKFAVAPTVGRIAMLLDKPEVALHWVTAAPVEWTGVSSTNRVIDASVEQLAPVKLKVSDWNEAVVRVEGDYVTLTLNGEVVYRRVWEDEAGRVFGLFHDPTDSQVRVRNVRFSGDWPDKLPSDLFELKPGGKI